MGFTSKKNSKVVTRDKISGFFIPTDVSVGEYGADDINKRVAAQQDAMNEGIVQDWENGFDEAGNPALGDALRRKPGPRIISTQTTDPAPQIVTGTAWPNKAGPRRFGRNPTRSARFPSTHSTLRSPGSLF